MLSLNNSYSEAKNIQDYGILSIMYHRFDENKYPSTNIRIPDFKTHLELIENSGFKFISHNDFESYIEKDNLEKKILLTIDDGFSSFYENAWPILKQKEIPFIIFINTETVGSRGYMSWSEIKEISKFNFVHVGNHSHSHGYLVDKSDDEIEKDIKTSIKIFKKELNNQTKFFAYPFGEYKESYKEIVKKLGFKYAFGQHSGVIDKTKNKYELPRFPINEKYGDLERFKFLLSLYPLEYQSISIEDMLILENNNPPKFHIKFFKEQINLKNINCFSNEGGDWKDTKIKLEEEKLYIILKEKFKPRRGRINCSLKENDKWKWLGLQFVIK